MNLAWMIRWENNFAGNFISVKYYTLGSFKTSESKVQKGHP